MVGPAGVVKRGLDPVRFGKDFIAGSLTADHRLEAPVLQRKGQP